MEINNICVVGLGYIGLPTAATFASRGKTVIGVDVNQDVIDCINKGDAHIVEPDLDFLVQGTVKSGKLQAYDAPQKADAFIIAVPTPLRENNRPDISMVETAARNLAPSLEKRNVVILESTSPVGTTARIEEILKEERPDLSFPCDAGEDADICIAYCPERILPGRLLIELIENDRIIGGLSKRSTERAKDVYGTFVTGQMLETNAQTAEMVKLAENTFRDVNIALANELADICHGLDIDPWEMIGLANHHPRVNILQPGPGVGGHCIAVDPWFVVHSAPEKAKVVRAAREVNEFRPKQVVQEILAVAGEFKAPKVACFGLAYKPNIDDMRESPAIEIVSELADSGLDGLSVMAVEPFVDALPKAVNKDNVSLVDAATAIADAHILVMLVDHQQFVTMDKTATSQKIIIDTRGVWK